MKKFFTPGAKLILVLAVVGALTFAIFTLATDQSGFFTNVINTISTPLRNGSSAFVRQVESTYDKWYQYDLLEAENNALKAQLAQMELDISEAQVIKRENERLSALVDLKEAHPDYDLEAAYVIGWDSANWRSVCTVSKGTDNGLAMGMCAVTQFGQVVGVITDIGQNWAEITTVLDPSLEMSATITASGYSGVVQGDYTYNGTLRMNYLQTDAILKNTDLVVTAGSLLYPKGLVLGTIVDANMDESGLGKYATLEPSAQFSELEQVFVITNYEE